MIKKEVWRWFLVAGAIIATAAGTYFGVRHARTRSVQVIDAAPQDSFLIVTLDVRGTRSSPFAPLLGNVESIFGTSRLGNACAAALFAHVTEVGLIAPEEGEGGDFGVAASADINKATWTGCAESVMKEKGGQPQMARHGSYFVLTDATPTPAKPGSFLQTASVASDGQRTFLLGQREWLTKMMDASEGKIRSAKFEGTHFRTRSALSSTIATGTATLVGASAKPLLMASIVLPKVLRERVREELGTGSDKLDPTMLGILGVEAAGAALFHDAINQRVQAAVYMGCDRDESCARVRELLERKKQDLLNNMALRLMGLSEIVETLTIEQKNAQITIRAQGPASAVSLVVQKFAKGP